MSIIEFMVRQRWRISQTYLLLVPFIAIINTFLYFVIAVGVTDLFDLNIFTLSVILLTPIILINLFGYILDKVGYFKTEQRKNMRSNTVEIYKETSDYTALFTALYMKLSKEEIEEKSGSIIFPNGVN